MLVELSLQFPPREKVFIALSVLLLTSIAIDQIILWTDEYEAPQKKIGKSATQEYENSRVADSSTVRSLSDEELYNLSLIEDAASDYDQHVLPIGQHSEMAFSTGLVFWLLCDSTVYDTCDLSFIGRNE